MEVDVEKSVADSRKSRKSGKSMAQPGFPKVATKDEVLPVRTAPAQEGLGRIGRTKEQGEGYQETSDEGDRSLQRREKGILGRGVRGV